ncbi:hypothetical protein [Fluviicola sp.]|jgi:hypothetical protein|uniref:hypothetical protein n=1 Tax=Fluviicola sp. TaxID=1917219 RepID=UPI00282A60F1|nr:hypothetical protein [Fluviicola sp.]MDR0803189.1 hypothetical protein [Fluviicola sp.]
MKSILHQSVFFLILLAIVGCSKKNNTPNSAASVTTNSFFLKKDGISFTPVYIEVLELSSNSVAVTATASLYSNANLFSFMIDKQTPVGSYDYETLIDEYGFWFAHSDSDFDILYINEGVIEIVQQDTIQKILEVKFQLEIEGSTAQTHQITEGHFKVHY